MIYKWINQCISKTKHSKGISLIEVLVCLCILAISIAGIVEAYACTAHMFVKNAVHYIASIAAHNKIEELRAANFTDLREGSYSDVPYVLIERTWKIRRKPYGFAICVATVTNTGVLLVSQCIQRMSYE
jgi:Tfp pilus assembly protein PilV